MRVNVSSVQDFYQCRFRWWCTWVKNRVPVATSPALDAGRLLHRIFERHFREEIPLLVAAQEEHAAYLKLIPDAHPAAKMGAFKAAAVIADLMEALPLWEDKIKVACTLEVEEPFEWDDPVLRGVTWLGRPDRVVVVGNSIWHVQNRGLAASMNFGTYMRLASRHYHEHLYAEALAHKWLIPGRNRKYGGTVFNLVRKLKFRTNVGKKNEDTKTADEMFFQRPMVIDLKGPLHRSVMMAMRQHVVEMQCVIGEWNDEGIIPAPNEKMNGGYSGSSEDPYFRVLIGEISLEDDDVFKDREDTYATVTPE